MEENGSFKKQISELEHSLSKLRAEHAETMDRLTDTKQALRDAELNCNKLYKDIGSTNASHVNNIHES